MTSETGRQRSQRIDLNYFRKRTGLDRLRSVCVLVALVATGAYVAYVFLVGNRETHLSTGPLAKAHATFESDCKQCHQGFSPIDSQANQFDLTFVGINAADSVARIEESCRACHAVGDHYRNTMTAEASLSDQNCAGCHHDHLGRDHNLLSIASSMCASCHENLQKVCRATPNVSTTIASFTLESHGDFKSLSQPDPGVIKFDHGQHMRAGQVDRGDRGAFKLSMLDPAIRDRYRGQNQSDDDFVQLDCASCHQPSGNPDPLRSLATDGELGRYMSPISFDKHCSACHAMNSGIATEQTTPIPHAVPWQQTELFLASTLRGAIATGIVRNPGDDSQATPQPGEGFGVKVTQNQPTLSDVDPRIRELRAMTETQCLKCHEPSSITDAAIFSAKQPHAKPMIPPRWLKQGLFDHAAHHELDCRFCHGGAYLDEEIQTSAPPSDHQKVMIAGIESCVGCHRDENIAANQAALPSSELLRGMRTWATNDCMLCHRYHRRDQSR